MKKVSLLSLLLVLICGSLMAQEPQVLIADGFEEYTVGNKIALEGQAAGHTWWTTWSNTPGSSEDGVVAEFDGSKCGYLTYGVDQVLLLGDEENGVYDLEFDILVPQGKNGYFNILHDFNGSGSTWALESYLHMSGSGSSAPGTGAIYAGSQTAITFTVVYDAWMHFRLHVDTDGDVAEYYYTAPGENETMIATWQWSLNAQGTATVGRKLAAMDFYPPQNTANSMYYLDNFSYTKVSGDTYAVLDFDPEEIDSYVEVDDVASVDITISNEEGTSVGEWTAWVDFGAGAGGTSTSTLYYGVDPAEGASLVGYNWDEPKLVEVAAMFPGSTYAGSAMGTNIVSVEYFAVESTSGFGYEANTPLTFRVYKQGMYGQPGEVIAEKVIPYAQINHTDWTTATFDTPIALTGYNVWIACEYTQAVGGYGMVFDGGSYLPNSGFVRVGGGGAFESAGPDNMSQDYGCMAIRANVQGSPVSATWATLSKSDGSIPKGGTDELTVNLNAIGLSVSDVKEADIIFVTNDPEQPEVIIPLTLIVTGEGINEAAANAINVYPNPTTGMVTVEGENITAVAIYSAAGQLISVVNTTTIDMSTFGTGVYFLNVIDNANNTTVQRVVVK